MASSEHNGEPSASALERALRTQAQLHLLAKHQERLEEMAVVIHRATCPTLGCGHEYVDVDPQDVQRAQYVLNAIEQGL